MINALKVEKTAKVETFGDPEKANNVIFVLHGYGQLVEYFIRKFKVLNQSDYFVVAPEGLHRFYLKGSSGRVGASWMTKEERTSDISDYINYLNLLWDKIDAEYTFKNKILLGFSQGGATASRWHCLGNFKADRFVLWAAVFPPDMHQENCEAFNQSKNVLVFGNQDEYYSESSVDENYQSMLSDNLDFELLKFEGGHNIDSKTLLNLLT